MKITLPFNKNRFLIIAGFCFLVINLLNINTVYSQVDFFYGRNNSGLRIGAGVGVSTLITHFTKNPPKMVGVGSLDYDFNPYFSAGLEAQYGTLQGIDAVTHLPYYSSTDKFMAGNLNVRVAIGQFDNFYSGNVLQDVIKRIYIGAGVGQIKTNITLVDNPGREFSKYGTPMLQDRLWVFPFNIGTNIDLTGVLGYDRVSINPNFQFNYVNSMYLDGFQSSQYSHLKGFYNLTSIKIKYKF